MADTKPQETLNTSKSPETAKDAPPTLAEPASGPVAEMTGALPVGQPAPKPSPSPATVPPISSTSEPAASNEASATVNGTSDSIEDKKETAASTADARAAPVTEADKSTEPAQTSAAKQDTEMSDAAPADTDADADADAAAAAPQSAENELAPATNGASASAASKNKRKSSTGVPEHKSKTLKKKQSKAKITNLDAKPGDHYLARLKSYPPWPSIICDEDMLPDVLLNSRPKTAIKDDGSYHEDYADGGKKVTERTYAVMFLYTNEFGWIPNTDLQPLDPESCKDVVEKGKSKTLLEAYKVAAENHDIDHFKELLMAHDAALQEEENKRAEKQAEKAEKAAKKGKRKSEVKADSDTEMVDADDAAPKKASKKRKKDAEADEEGPEKPPKTPKTTKLKLTTGKTPATEKKTKEKATPKPKADKKKKAAETEDEKEPEKEVPAKDPVQARKDQEKEVLFLRHKLQKGFLSRDQEPSEDEMPQMANFIKKLEAYGSNLDAQIIRNTKINKVLKGILKLQSIPKDDEYHFKDRSAKILADWNQVLGTEPTDAEKAPAAKKEESTPAAMNGVHKEAEEKAEEKITTNVEEPKDKTMSTEETVEKISAEVTADAGAKAEAIDAVQNDESSTEDKKSEPAPATEDKAPESATAAAEVNEVVKATE